MKPLHLQKPHLIVVVGIPGSGKTFFAEQFARTHHVPFLNYAELRAKLPSDELTADVAEYMLGKMFYSKRPVLLEGIGNQRDERLTIMEVARRQGYVTTFVWAQVDPISAKKRAIQSSKISAREFDRQLANFTQLSAAEPHVVISGRHTFNTQANNVIHKLAQEQAATQNSPAQRQPIQAAKVGETVKISPTPPTMPPRRGKTRGRISIS